MLLSITMKISIQKNNWLSIAEFIRRNLEDYVVRHNLRALVLGVSGGIDSALTAALAAEACRKLGISLYGRSITIETNTEAEKERARAVGNAFCTDFREVDLTTLYLSVREEMGNSPCFLLCR